MTNVHKGHVPSQSQSVARSVAPDVVSPPSAVRRIDRYDGERVTSHSRSHRTDRVEHETVAVATCIGRMVQLCGEPHSCTCTKPLADSLVKPPLYGHLLLLMASLSPSHAAQLTMPPL